MADLSKIDIASNLLDTFTETKVKELIELRPWMKSKKFRLLTKQTEIEEFIDICISKGRCVYDLETTSLNTRKDENEASYAQIVGVCLSHDPDEGVYIPVAHEDAQEFNVPISIVLRETSRLVANCVLIFHHFKYDGQVLRNYGIIIDREDQYEDTYLMAAIQDASRKEKGLKYLSGALLDRPQLEMEDLGIQGTKKNIVAFNMVPPQKAVYYGGSDGMNTMALYLYLKAKLDAMDPTGKEGPWLIYKVEKRCLFVTLEMERNYVKIDKAYLVKTNADVEIRMQKIIREIYDIAGHEFDINSTQQLGVVLFEEMKLPYPDKALKTKTGHYQTNSEILEMISTKNPIVNLILIYRGYVKIQSTYLYNWLKNADINDEVKFQLNQIQADTGRYSGSGGKGIDIDGYCGVNCQNIPTFDKKDPHAINLRRAMVAHFGYKMVSIDYSGEELRIATNFSREPKWIQEFLHGTGDLHTITGKIITGKSEITKKERSLGKTLNFLTMYGGGAGGFAAQAKIPYETAKKMIVNFFKEYSGLNDWIKRECRQSRKRGYSKTAFGRRRPLDEFYNSPDKGIQAKGDRCAVNSAVQGCLQKDERVLTNKGYYTIIELYQLPNDIVKTMKVWTGTSWEYFSVINRGSAQYAELELSNGMILKCDTRHEVLVVGKYGYEFKHFRDLDYDTDICVSIPTAKEFGEYPGEYSYISEAHNGKSIHIDSEEQWDFIAYLMGYVIGDGTVRVGSRHSITLSLGKEKIDRYFSNIEENVEKLGLNFSTMRKIKSAKEESYQIQINSKGLIELFLFLGYAPANAKNKHIPEIIFRAPYKMRKAFIQGYFDTDGCKKRANRYGYHTPNRGLLQDTQLIGWSIGLPSIVRPVKGGNYRLEWQNLKKVEEVLSLNVTTWDRVNTINKMILPEFLRGKIINALQPVYNRKSSKERSYFCKLNTGKKVTLPGMLSFMDKYGKKLEGEIYYHYKLKRKTIFEHTEDTYTLSVHSNLHRFDSAGIISKNTGSDIIKIALWRVYKWILDNELQDDVKILLPVHDEILYEIKEDKLDMIIPELCNLMKIRDLTDKLNWEVPLDVDAEYGDSFDVDHNYWEEIKERMVTESVPKEVKEIPESKKVEDLKTIKDLKTIEDFKKIEEVTKGEDSQVEREMMSITSNDNTNYCKNMTVKGNFDESIENRMVVHKLLDGAENKIQGPSLFKDTKTIDCIDDKGYFNYTIDIDALSAYKIKFILEIMKASGNKLFIGPKNKICLLSKHGEIFYKSAEEISVDAFLALCLMLDV